VSINRDRRSAGLILLLAFALGVCVFAVTQISYGIVEDRALAPSESLGFVSLAMDIYSYYSFIHQAAGGSFFFRNNMTHETCSAAFINLQWWLAGRCMAWFDWSPQFLFIVWRFAGSIALMLGFAVLALVTLEKPHQQVVALLMCAFGGGFGWAITIFGAMGLLDLSDTFGLRNPAMDLITAIHPFGQIMKNPHYSLPHGTLLLFLACYVMGERSGCARWYAVAAGVAVLQGLFRPYDTITIMAMIPFFIGVESLTSRKLDVRRATLRLLPAIASAPLLFYYYYLFSIHPIFTYWAEQGKQPPASMFWHTLSLGLVGLLCIYRVARRKRLPLAGSWERMLAVFAATVLILYHGNHLTRLLSFSPQIGIPLVSVLILLSMPVLSALAARWSRFGKRGLAAALVGFLILNALSSPLYVQWSGSIGAITPRNYITPSEREAILWLAERAEPDDVILSGEPMGARIAFLTPLRVAMGHWALTPNVKLLKRKFERFAIGDLPPERAVEFIKEVQPRYILLTDIEDAGKPAYYRKNAGAERVFANDDTIIYEVVGPPQTR